jgi:hypothetical protein
MSYCQDTSFQNSIHSLYEVIENLQQIKERNNRLEEELKEKNILVSSLIKTNQNQEQKIKHLKEKAKKYKKRSKLSAVKIKEEPILMDMNREEDGDEEVQQVFPDPPVQKVINLVDMEEEEEVIEIEEEVIEIEEEEVIKDLEKEMNVITPETKETESSKPNIQMTVTETVSTDNTQEEQEFY